MLDVLITMLDWVLQLLNSSMYPFFFFLNFNCIYPFEAVMKSFQFDRILRSFDAECADYFVLDKVL